MPSPQLGNIGLALQGLGAGLQGQLPQFLQVQNQKQGLQLEQRQQDMAEQQQQLVNMENRQKAMFQDAQAALQLAESGNIEGVVKLGINRLQMLKQVAQFDPNVDPSDTQRITQLAIAARNGEQEALELLKDELRSTTETGMAMGFLKAPERDLMTVSAGQTVFDRNTNQPVFTAPQNTPESFRALESRAAGAGFQRGTAEYQQFMAQGGANSETQNQRAMKIQSLSPQLISQLNLTPEQAQTQAANIIDGIIRYDVTEQGRVLETNTSTGAVRELPISGQQAQAINGAAGAEASAQAANGRDYTLFGISEEVSGPGPTAKALANRAASMLGIDVFSDTTTNRDLMQASLQNLTRAYSINDQYPVREMERIREDIGKYAPKLLGGGPDTRASMKALHMSLSQTLETARRDAANPEMPTELRAGAARAANDAKNFLDLMGYLDVDLLKTPQDVMNAPLSSLVEFVRSTPDEELAKLPAEVEEAIFRRAPNAGN